MNLFFFHGKKKYGWRKVGGVLMTLEEISRADRFSLLKLLNVDRNTMCNSFSNRRLLLKSETGNKLWTSVVVSIIGRPVGGLGKGMRM